MSADRTESKFVTVEPDVQIHVWDAGDPSSPALVFLPGLTFSGEVFMRQLEHFSDRYRVVLVDPRGQGLSTKSPWGNDYQTHGADLIKVLAALGVKRPTLVGWSCGNLEAWSFLEQAGIEAAAACVTIDMSPLPLSDDPTCWTEGSHEELSEVVAKTMIHADTSHAFWDEYLREVMWEGPISDDEYEYLMDMGARTPFWVAHELFGDALLSDYRAVAQEAAKIIPTIMFIAEHWADVAEPYFNALCPETPTVVMGAHLMAYQRADEFNARLDQFLEELA